MNKKNKPTQLTLKYFNRCAEKQNKYNEIYFEMRDHNATMRKLLGGVA